MENAGELQSPVAPRLSENETALLQTARELSDSLLVPRAQAIDNGEIPVADNLQALADAGLVAITTPIEWGGAACSGSFMREFTELLTSSCGTTWFTVTQHLGSCATIANCENPRLRERFLRQMARGQHWVGVGFGHLRRPEPMLRALPVEGGYRLTGTAPWVTGWPLLNGVIYGATLPDDRHVYLYADAVEGPHQTATPPLPLCAMNASATTEVHLDDLFIPQDQWVKFSSREEMARGDFGGIAGAVAPPLGCARGSLRVLREVAARRVKLTAIADAADALEIEIDACRAEAYRWAEGPKDIPEYAPNALRARAAALTLAVRAAHQAVAASGGGANSRHHPAQRLFREAMFYTLIAQTAEIMAATLEALAPQALPPVAPEGLFSRV